jgi:hypothetical protein
VWLRSHWPADPRFRRSDLRLFSLRDTHMSPQPEWVVFGQYFFADNAPHKENNGCVKDGFGRAITFSDRYLAQQCADRLRPHHDYVLRDGELRPPIYNVCMRYAPSRNSPW